MTGKNWRYLGLYYFWQGVDLLFPPQCAGCGRTGSRWCADCQAKVRPVAAPFCPTCGLPVPAAGRCPTCRRQPPAFAALRSWAVFEPPVRQALHQLKYRRNLGLGEALARQMFPFVRDLGWEADVFVPVPLSAARFRERGYNQVGLVARPLALLLGWRYLPQALTRVRETRSQVGLRPAERRANVAGAFQAQAVLATGKRVVLMDDVATTGATLDAAAQALRRAGAAEVRAVTIARALPRHGWRQV